MGRQLLSGAGSRLLCIVVIALLGCHADMNDPKGQAEELADPVRREHAIGRLHSIFSQRLVEAKGDRNAQSLKQFSDAAHANMVKVFLEHPEDTQNGLKILTLMAEMRDPRTLPALLKALEWRSEVSEEHAVAAARTLGDLEIPEDKRGEVVQAVSTALERIDGARGIDNRMRKAFIELLGQLEDKRAADTLVKIALTQDESQSFLFNKLAAQQLVAIADPSTVDAMVKALYTFDPAQPTMRMMEDAEAVLVAIGKPSLEPLLKARKGENEEVNKLVELSIESFRRLNPEVAASMNKQALIAREATLALGRLGFPEALDALLDEASQAHPDRRATAALALVGIRVPPKEEKRVVDAMIDVYQKSEKQGRPQLLVAIRHLYADSVMPFLHDVAKTTERELPPVQMYGFVSYALLANKQEAQNLKPILAREELIRPHIKDYTVAIAAAEECDTNVDCWIGKLKSDDKIVLRKAANMLARYGRGNDKAVQALLELFGHRDLEVRVEALNAVDHIADNGSEAAVKRIDELQAQEGGRSIWNNFKREALPTRSRLVIRGNS